MVSNWYLKSFYYESLERTLHVFLSQVTLTKGELDDFVIYISFFHSLHLFTSSFKVSSLSLEPNILTFRRMAGGVLTTIVILFCKPPHSYLHL